MDYWPNSMILPKNHEYDSKRSFMVAPLVAITRKTSKRVKFLLIINTYLAINVYRISLGGLLSVQ